MTWRQLPLFEDRTRATSEQGRLFKTMDDSYTLRLDLDFHPGLQRAIAKIEARTSEGELVAWTLRESCVYDENPDLFNAYVYYVANLFKTMAHELNEPF